MSICLLSIIDTAVSFSAFCHETVASLRSQNITDIAKYFFLNTAVSASLEIKSSDNLRVLQFLWNTDQHLFNSSVMRNPGTQLVFIPLLQILLLACFQGGNITKLIQMVELGIY